MRRIRKSHVLVAALAGALCVPASGVSKGSAAGGLPTKIGKGEGSLNLIEWPAYSDKSFANKFVKDTGWRPARAVPVAGALAYSKYNFFIRFVMKRIARKAGAPTDTSRAIAHFSDGRTVDALPIKAVLESATQDR